MQFGPHLRSLWDLFHPRLSEPSAPAHHNKQALLSFWYHVTSDCIENAQLIINNPEIIKNIAFNYILYVYLYILSLSIIFFWHSSKYYIILKYYLVNFTQNDYKIVPV